jgi:hypothetical protein
MTPGRLEMRDLLFVAATMAFFLVALAYVGLCERLK